MLDIFNNSAFSLTNLTDAINNMRFVPGRIGELGLFGRGSGVNTTSIAIEEKNGILILVPPTPRGGPGTTADKPKRAMRNLVVPHFEINDGINADEVQGVRAFGSETELETIVGKVAEREAQHGQSMEATTELSRIGAVKGIVTYADGSTLNLFTEFGVTQETEIDFDLDNATPADGVLRQKCAAVTRQVANILDGVPFSGLHAFCGDNFFDNLLQHKEVRDTYKGWNEAQILRDSYLGSDRSSIFGTFQFGGIVWENYRGAVGSTTYVNADKCHIFPKGVPNLFRTVWAPADYVETVNTIGKRFYAKQWPYANGKGVHLDVQMNEINYCTRPRVLIPGRRT